VKYYLHQIPGITQQFVLLNENTFLMDELELSYFKDRKSGSNIIRTLVSLPITNGFIYDNSISNTYKFFKKEDIIIDSFGPILIDISIIQKIHAEYKSNLINTSTHRFLIPSDYSYTHFYLLSLITNYADKVTFQKSEVKFLLPDNTDEYGFHKQLSSLTSQTKILFLSDDLLRSRYRIGLDTFFYRIYPDISHLEVNIEDYERVGLIIGLVFLFGSISCCYVITRCLGGNIKQKDFQEYRQR